MLCCHEKQISAPLFVLLFTPGQVGEVRSGMTYKWKTIGIIKIKYEKQHKEK
jgi:hypothetical protein